MVSKNWKKISSIADKQLQMRLITAGGELERLAREFPKYFFREEKEYPHVVRREFLIIMSRMKQRDDVIKACKDAGIPYHRFSFRGCCNGDTEDIPYTTGSFSTPSDGRGQYFWRSKKHRGDAIEYEGVSWLVVWDSFDPGIVVGTFAAHTLIIVPAEALKD